MRGILSIIFIIFCSISLYAQGVQIGVLGGPILFKSNDDNVRWGPTDLNLTLLNTYLDLGWNAGVLMRSKSSKLFGYDVEIGVVSKAFMQNGDLSNANVMFKDNVVYLSLPAHLKIRITPKLSVLIGAEMNYKLSSIAFDSFNSGLSNGLVYDFSKKIGLRFRYSYGLDNAVEYTLVDLNNTPVGTLKKKFHGLIFSGVYYLN